MSGAMPAAGRAPAPVLLAVAALCLQALLLAGLASQHAAIQRMQAALGDAGQAAGRHGRRHLQEVRVGGARANLPNSGCHL